MNISEIIDRKFGSYQIEIVILCFLTSLIDGLDSQIMSATGPSASRELMLAPSALGPVLSASQWGALFGAFIFGNYADRVGRRRVLILCGLLLGFTMLGTALADSLYELVVLRVLCGLGVGGALPCFIALSVEFSPRRYRGTVASVVASAVPLGGIVVGMLGAALLPTLGWRAMFLICGGFSIAITLLLALRLPESISFAIARHFPADDIRKVLERIAPGEIASSTRDFRIEDDDSVRQAAPVRQLFARGRASLTALCWSAFFLSYLALIGTFVWTPGLMRQAGMSIGAASLVLSFDNVGGIAGFAIAGYLADRFRSRFWWILMLFYLCGAVSVMLMGLAAPAFWPTALCAVLFGFFLSAGIGGLYLFASQFYPVVIRSTGVGWASGVGRLGASVGPLTVGGMFARGWNVTEILSVLGALAVVNVGIVRWMRIASRPGSNSSHENDAFVVPTR